MSRSDFLTENFRTLVVLAGGYALAVQQGYIGAPDIPIPEELPNATGIFIIGGLALAFGGYVAAGKITDLIPEEEGIYLVCLEAQDETGGEVWNLSRDRFADLDVAEGSLHQWKSLGEVYECYTYNPETNTAVAGWRGSPADSQLAGGVDLIDAYEAIDELRTEYEPAQRKLKRIRRRLRSVARRMDRRRLEEHNAMLDPTLSPSFGDSELPSGPSEVLQEELPDELLPEPLQEENDADQEADQEEEEFVSLDLLDQEPVKND